MQKAFSAVLASSMVFGSAALAQDWSGFYGGLSYNSTSGTYYHYNSGVLSPINTLDIDGSSAGVLAGYNMQSGNMVYGIELAYAPKAVSLADSPIYYFDKTLDLRARVGYAAGKALVYGSLGMARADQHWEDGFVTNSPVKVDGVSYGLGVDYLVTDKVFLGLAYQRVTLVADEGEIGGLPIVETNDEIDTISLRVGMRF